MSSKPYWDVGHKMLTCGFELRKLDERKYLVTTWHLITAIEQFDHWAIDVIVFTKA